MSHLKARVLLATAVLTLTVDEVRAEPLRLRGDAFAQTPSPTGLLVLSGEDHHKPWFSAEGLVWMGAGKDAYASGDVLTIAVRLREPKGRAEVTLGRIMIATGSIRPLHLDGARALARTPWGMTLEAFGGAPVVPRFADRAYDWAVGGRLAQALGSQATVGAAYLHRRDVGNVADEEVGGDLAWAPTKTFDVAARGAYDVVSYGLVDALVSASLRFESIRLEGFVTQRSPSRLLPATSLFSVFGNVAATRAGTTVRWALAPRLDVLGSAAAHVQGERAGYDVFARSTLCTDDEGVGSIGVELRRQGLPETSWTGLRGFATLPLSQRLRAATELELVAPDVPRGRGSVWPWALVALNMRATERLDLALAAEASARPTVAREFVGILRASYAWSR